MTLSQTDPCRLPGWLRVAARAGAGLAWTTAVAALLVASWTPTVLSRRSGATKRAGARRLAKRIWARGLLLAVGVRVRVEGRPPPSGTIVVSNHLGYIDIPVVDSVAPTVFVARADLRRWPFLGPLASLGGTIFVDRATKSDVLAVRRRMLEALARRERVLVFPEATSTSGATILPFKSALLADAAARGLPVYWVTLTYRAPGASAGDRVCWGSDVGFVAHLAGLLALRRVECTVRFGRRPVLAGDRKELASELRRRMMGAFEPVEVLPNRYPPQGDARTGSRSAPPGRPRRRSSPHS